jgi:hypothetical protein
MSLLTRISFRHKICRSRRDTSSRPKGDSLDATIEAELARASRSSRPTNQAELVNGKAIHSCVVVGGPP